MNALLLAIKKRLQWRLLAIIEKPFTDHLPTDQETKQRLETLEPGEQVKLLVIVKIISWIDRLEGNHGRNPA